jgi:methionyl-tRNA formyltransferase
VPSLRALVTAGHEVVMVVTRPDRRRGRGGAVSASPVKHAALSLGLPVRHRVADVLDSGAELGVVVAYGAMIPASVLEVVPMLNVHFSLLPRWRGAAPVQRAILAGDPETGVSIMGLEVSLDTGPVYASAATVIDSKSAASLTAELAEIGASVLIDVLSADELPVPRPQHGEATYAAKLDPAQFRLNPERSAIELERLVRAGRAHARVNDRRVLVLEARVLAERSDPGSLEQRGDVVLFGAREGVLEVRQVQPEASRAMTAGAWWAGARLADGTKWGDPSEPSP